MVKNINKVLSLMICIALLVTLSAACGGNKQPAADNGTTQAGTTAVQDTAAPAAETAKIIMISWRTEDTDFWKQINDQFTKANPGIAAEFKPIKNTEYDSYVQTSMASGNAEDLLMSRSFDAGAAVFNGGYTVEITEADFPNIKNFPEGLKNGFKTADGKQFAAPGCWVAHGMLYNKKIFQDLNLTIPETWDDFFKVCEAIKAKGIIPIAMASKDGWTLANMGTSQVVANCVGGEEWRQKMLKGEDNMLNPGYIKHFEILNKMKDYFPKGYEGVSYTDTQQLFVTEQAAIFPAGSWEIGYFKKTNPDLDMGVFQTPVLNKGDKNWLSFFPDSGYAINKKTKALDAAKIYVNWLCGKEGAQAVSNFVPGFFPSNPDVTEISDDLAKQWLTFVGEGGNNLMIWYPFDKIAAQQPDASTLTQEAMAQMFAGKFTPRQAAEHVQNGLAAWYEPFKK